MKAHVVAAVSPGSLAEALEIRPGYAVLKINGREIEDIFDYDFFCQDTQLELLLRNEAGEEVLYEIEKDEFEDLGLQFENGLMDDYHSCCNKCIFCFIDQMPPGMRETLYFKDDDSRLSFLQGNYVTLTNMKDRDIERIIEYHLAPINISVHTMNPELRCRMLHNRFAGEALKKLDRLKEAQVPMNGQIVLCPDWNDKEELEYTLRKLEDYAPHMQSVSVVPVGLTRFREGLEPLRLLTKEEACDTIDRIEACQKRMIEKYGIHFVHASDEIYLLAERELPEEERYDGYIQLENGVGMLRLFITEFREEMERHSKAEPREVSLATGRLAAPVLKQLLNELEERFPGVKVHLYPITNHFFGENITVAGLITAQDLIAQLKGQDLGECLYIPKNMLRSGEDVFLDDIHVGEVEEALGIKVIPAECSGAATVKAVLNTKKRTRRTRIFRPYELKE